MATLVRTPILVPQRASHSRGRRVTRSGPTWAARALVLRAGVLLALLSPATLRGQAESVPRRGDRYWINGGVGVGVSHRSERGFGGLGGSLSASYQHGSTLFSLRTAGVWEILGGDAIGDVALLGGLATRQKGAHASLALGPGIAGGEIGRGLFGTPTQFHSTLGLAAQVQGFGIAFGALGLGLYGYANFNAHHSFGGLTLAIQFGELH